jgi:hypothetical protein
MTFEQILAQARSVRSSLGSEDRPPTVLVERMGRLKAIVSLPFDRPQALDMVVKTRIGFAASSLTLAADSYMRTGPKGLESYKHGDMRRLVEAGHGTKRGITDAIVLSPAERIDNETVITFPLVNYLPVAPRARA